MWRSFSHGLRCGMTALGCSLAVIGWGLLRHVEERLHCLPTATNDRWNAWLGGPNTAHMDIRTLFESSQNLHLAAIAVLAFGVFVAVCFGMPLVFSRKEDVLRG